MPALKVHHIGYLVKKMEAATRSFEALGYEITQPATYDEIRKIWKKTDTASNWYLLPPKIRSFPA